MPAPGWRPDPGWPPAPANWPFWVDEVTGQPPPADLPAPGVPVSSTASAQPDESEASVGSGEPAAVSVTAGTSKADAPSDLVRAAAVPTDVVAQPRPGWRERRAEKQARKEHDAALSAWQAEQDQLDRLAAAAADAVRGVGVTGSGIICKSGELALWVGQAALIEPRRQPGQYVGAYSGVSVRIAKGVRYNLGGSRGHYVPGPEVQTPVDTGRLVVTTSRLVFAGGKTTREWAHGKLVGVDVSDDERTALIHVSNRAKVSGVHLGRAPDGFAQFYALGVAIAQHGGAPVAGECERAAAEHRADQP